MNSDRSSTIKPKYSLASNSKERHQGLIVKRRREAGGFSREQFAARAGLHRETHSRLVTFVGNTYEFFTNPLCAIYACFGMIEPSDSSDAPDFVFGKGVTQRSL